MSPEEKSQAQGFLCENDSCFYFDGRRRFAVLLSKASHFSRAPAVLDRHMLWSNCRGERLDNNQRLSKQRRSDQIMCSIEPTADTTTNITPDKCENNTYFFEKWGLPSFFLRITNALFTWSTDEAMLSRVWLQECHSVNLRKSNLLSLWSPCEELQVGKHRILTKRKCTESLLKRRNIKPFI